MNHAPSRIFLARLIGQRVFDPSGDLVGKLRDVVVLLRPGGKQPRVVGMVVEVLGRRRVFLPMTRVTSLDSGHIVTTGVVNMRKFEQRTHETLVVHELFDRTVEFGEGRRGSVFDVAMVSDPRREWSVTQVAVLEGANRFGRRGQTQVLDWSEVRGLVSQEYGQGATHLLATMDQMHPTDLANALRDLTPKRRAEIVAELVDERLADVLEELPKTVQVEILGVLDPERGADILEEMAPDDAADLVKQLPPAMAESLMDLMEEDEADDVRQLLVYPERTAGALMTIDAVVLSPDSTVAEALARVREPELPPALAAMIYVCRPPLETPTGRFLGIVHTQALLREPPSTLVGQIVQSNVEWPRPDSSLEQVTATLAAYNLVACPVIDELNHLVGAVTIDDVIDHLLPEGWRDVPIGGDRS